MTEHSGRSPSLAEEYLAEVNEQYLIIEDARLRIPDPEIRKLYLVKNASQEEIEKNTPRHLYINPEAVGNIQFNTIPHYKIDMVANDVMAEVVSLLPKTFDEYSYINNYSYEKLEIPGLDTVGITLHDAFGVFRSIDSIRIGNFRILNCRDTGLVFNNQLVDASNPQYIEIGSNDLLISLLDEKPGVFITIDGKRYTNDRVYTRFGWGSEDDGLRDELYRTYDDPHPSMLLNAAEVDNDDDWEQDEDQLSWFKIQDESIVWIAENILFPLRAARQIALN